MPDISQQLLYRRRVGFLAALLLGGAAWGVLWPWYGWVELRHRLVYDLGEGQTWAAPQWRGFLDGEANRLFIDSSQSTTLHIMYDVNVAVSAFAAIELKQVTQQDSTESLQLEGMLARYISNYQNAQGQTLSPSLPEETAVARERNPTRELLAFQREKLEGYIRQKNEFSEQRRLINADILALEKKIDGVMTVTNDEAYVQQIKPRIEREWHNDPALEELLLQLHQQRQTLAKLDVQAGSATTAVMLSMLDKQRKQQDVQVNELEDRIEHRKNVLAEHVQECFQHLYKADLQGKIEGNQKKLKIIEVQNEIVENDIGRISKNIEAAERALESEQQLNTLLIKPQAKPLRPHLRQGQAERINLYWRYAPWLSLSLAIIGWFAGWGMGGRIFRRRQQQPAPELFDAALSKEDVESFEGADIEEAFKEESFSKEPLSLSLEAGAITVACEPGETQEHIVGAPLMHVANELEEEKPAFPENNDCEPSPLSDYFDVANPCPPIPLTPTESNMTDYTGPAPKDRIYELRQDIACPIVLFAAEPSSQGSPRGMVNLAIDLVRDGLKVLLVDAEPDGGDLAAIFDLPQGPGFLDWRRGDAWLNRVAKAAALANLTVMGGGSPAAEQIHQEDISREIHRWDILRSRFDVALLYAPAALTTAPQTDIERLGVQLLNLADGVFVQVREIDRTDDQTLRYRKQLADYRANFMGWVLLSA